MALTFLCFVLYPSYAIILNCTCLIYSNGLLQKMILRLKSIFVPVASPPHI